MNKGLDLPASPATLQQHHPNSFAGNTLLILIETGPVQAIMTKP